MFSLWEDFKACLVQIYGDFKEEEIITKKMYEFKQTRSAIVYTTEF